MNFITGISKERFNEFVKKHEKSNFAQSYEWGSFKASSAEWDFDTVGLEDDAGVLVATALVLIRHLPIIKRTFLYIPRGFMIDFNDLQLLGTIVDAFKKYAISKKAIFFKIDPEIKYVDRAADGHIKKNATKNNALIEDLADLGFRHLGFTKDFDSTIQPRYTFRLGLDADEVDLLKGCHSKTRYNIKIAQKKGIEIIEATRDELPLFADIMKITGERDGFITRPLSYFADMYDKLHPSGMCKLYLAKLNTTNALEDIKKELVRIDNMIAKHEEDLENVLSEKRLKKIIRQLEDENHRLKKFSESFEEIEKLHYEHDGDVLMAGAITVHFGNKTWYLYGASDNLYREFMPNYLIQWHAITQAKATGYEIYDFFGVSGRTDEADPLHGLYRFKKGFGGELIEFIGEFDYVIKPFLYFSWVRVLPLFKKYRNKLVRRR